MENTSRGSGSEALPQVTPPKKNSKNTQTGRSRDARETQLVKLSVEEPVRQEEQQPQQFETFVFTSVSTDSHEAD